MMKRVFIYLIEPYQEFHSHILTTLLETVKKHNVTFLVYAKEYHQYNITNKDKLWTARILLRKYTDKQDLFKDLDRIKKHSKIIFVDTPNESLSMFVQDIRKYLWWVISEDCNIFCNKLIQRERLNKYAPDMTISYMQFDKDLDSYNDIVKKLGSPFILKPVNKDGSRGVVLIGSIEKFSQYCNLMPAWIQYMAEEYISWEIYSFTMYISPEGVPSYWYPFNHITWYGMWLPDFMLIWLWDFPLYKKVKEEDLKVFVKKSISAYGIKNTYVDFGFILTPENKLINLEVNWRIWWSTQFELREGYGINVYDLCFNRRSSIYTPVKKSISIIWLFPKRTGILKAYNEELLSKIKALESCTALNMHWYWFLGRKVGFAKDYNYNLWRIVLENYNREQFKSDYIFLKRVYWNLFIVE